MTTNTATAATNFANSFAALIDGMADARREAGMTEDEIFESLKASLLEMMSK